MSAAAVMTRAHSNLSSISEDEPMAYDSDFSEETTQTVLSNAASTVSSASSSSTTSPTAIDSVLSSDPTTEHMVLLDWDDTLMPTSYLLAHIDYEINEHSQIETFSLNGKLHGSPEDLREFVANLEKAGQAALDLLSKIFLKFKAQNIKIVTNGVRGWLPESLYVAGSFSKVYAAIERLMEAQSVEVIYARDYNIESTAWKTKCFDKILWAHFNQKDGAEVGEVKNMNVITIGDQWTDHESVAQCLTYYVYGESMSHHQLKLLATPDCRYLAIELNYIAELLEQTILFEFHLNTEAKAQGQKGVVLEFDGYNEEEDEGEEVNKDEEEEEEVGTVSD